MTLHIYNGWLNIYKPLGISSAKLVSMIKRYLKIDGIKAKIGHAGTLDLEAEGVLPLALGEATKLISILMDARKIYHFKIQFGARTDTGDKAGKIIQTTDQIPNSEECKNIVGKFLGTITQTPPKFSALKINGRRAYDLARSEIEFELQPREITIFDLTCLEYDGINHTATYSAECSKGTYIRTLAEDIALSLQSLGFVIELARRQVGIFHQNSAINASDLTAMDQANATSHLIQRILRIDTVLDDIPVLDIDDLRAFKVKNGQIVNFDLPDTNFLWLRYHDTLLAIGKIFQGRFHSSRVFNL